MRSYLSDNKLRKVTVLQKVKTCTIENYIYEGHIDSLQTRGNYAGGVQSSSLQQFNNQAIQSPPNILADIISD